MLARNFVLFRRAWLIVLLIGVSVFTTAVASARPAARVGDPLRLSIPGAPDAFYYRPIAGKGMKPVLMFLHGRGADVKENCRAWAKVARQFGWVVCPQGPEARANGTRGWNNNAPAGGAIAKAAVMALRAKYNRKVQLRGNVMIGFSEGTFVAMQAAVRDPVTWNRWLFLAANDKYWYGDGAQVLHGQRAKVKRVFLFTGETDEVAPNTRRVADLVRHEGIAVKLKIAPRMGHAIAVDRMVMSYRGPLAWLVAAK